MKTLFRMTTKLQSFQNIIYLQPQWTHEQFGLVCFHIPRLTPVNPYRTRQVNTFLGCLDALKVAAKSAYCPTWTQWTVEGFAVDSFAV